MQADTHIDAILCARPEITRINIVNRSMPRALKLASKWQDTLGLKVDFRVVIQDPASHDDETSEINQVLKDTDIICLTTNAPAPQFNGQYLKKGCHINGVGSYTPDTREVDTVTMQRCNREIIIDTPSALEVGDIVIAE